MWLFVIISLCYYAIIPYAFYLLGYLCCIKFRYHGFSGRK